jgi:hypothetical protein
LGIIRLEAEQFLEFGDGLVQLSLAAEDRAELFMGRDELRVECDGLAELGDGVVQFPLVAQDRAELFMGRDELGVELDGRGKVGGCLVVVVASGVNEFGSRSMTLECSARARAKASRCSSCACSQSHQAPNRCPWAGSGIFTMIAVALASAAWASSACPPR